MIKRLLKKAYAAHVAWYVLRNMRRTARARRHGAAATGGAYSSRSPAEAAARAMTWAKEFRSRVSQPALDRLDFVVEVGVGDSLAMCLLWIGFGARKVWGVDAFADPRDLSREKAIVESLLRAMPGEEGRRMREVVDLRGEALEVDESRLRYVANTPCEKLLEVVSPSSASVIYSLALLEHVQNLERGLESLYGALRPGGEMVHQVDLRNHGVLNEFGESAFLKPSPTMWRLMGSAWGLPNRKALRAYTETLEKLGAEVRVESDRKSEAAPTPQTPPPLSEPRLEGAVRVFWLQARRPDSVEPRHGSPARSAERSTALS